MDQHQRKKESRPAHDHGPGLFGISSSTAWKLVWILQLIFVLTALPRLDAPFLSVHFERQNQTYDLARHVFHEGWSAVVFPKASFSVVDMKPNRLPSFVSRVPFHGILAWPIAALTGQIIVRRYA